MKKFISFFLLLHFIAQAQSPITTFKLSRDKQYLLSGHYDGTANLWNLKDSRLEWTKIDYNSPVMSVDISFESNDVLVYSHHEGQIISRNKRGDIYFIKSLIKGSINSVILTSDGNAILASGQDSLIYILDSKSAELLDSIYQKLSSLENINRATTDAYNKYYATGHIDGTVKVWDLDNFSLISEKNYNNNAISSMVFNKDGNILSIGNVSGEIILYDLLKERFFSDAKRNDIVTSLYFRDGSRNIMSSHEDEIIIWKYSNNDLMSVVEIKNNFHNGFFSKASFFSDDQYLIVSSGNDGTLKLLDFNNSRLRAKIIAELISDKDMGWIIIGENGSYNGQGNIINKYKERAINLDTKILSRLF